MNQLAQLQSIKIDYFISRMSHGVQVKSVKYTGDDPANAVTYENVAFQDDSTDKIHHPSDVNIEVESQPPGGGHKASYTIDQVFHLTYRTTPSSRRKW